MVDYTEELVPPDYRNLVINPGGEVSIGATWAGSNGTVLTGVTDVAPVSGSGVAAYTVETTTSDSYHFSPLGPDEPDVHALAFAIPAARTVSFRVQLQADRPVYVQIQGSWLATPPPVPTPGDVDDTNAGTDDVLSVDTAIVDSDLASDEQSVDVSQTMGTPFLTNLTEMASTVITPTATLVDASGWVTFEVFVPNTDVPENVSHWRPKIVIYKNDPATDVSPPDLGTVIYADEAIILDSGEDLAGIPWFDGDTSGYEWEDIPQYSSSRTPLPALDVPPEGDIPPFEPVINPLDDSAGTFEFDTDPPIDPPPGEEVPVDPANADNPVLPTDLTPAQALNAQAERIIGHRVEPRHMSMAGDFQLGGLTLNTVDDIGVAWVVSDIEGWWTTSEPDVPDVPRAYFDGSFPTRGRYTARQFTITGTFFPSHPGDTPIARDRLVREINLCHKGGWFLAHEDPSPARTNTKGSEVWVAGAPLINTINTTGRTDFSLVLRAPDPVKYSIKDGLPPGYNQVSIVSTNTVQFPERNYPRQFPWKYPEAVFGTTDAFIENAGNTFVAPVIHVDGETAGPLLIQNITTGQTMRITQKLYQQERLDIDCATRQVTLNGVGNFRFYVDLDTDWISLQPGVNRIRFSEEVVSNQRSTLVMKWRSGWIG